MKNKKSGSCTERCTHTKPTDGRCNAHNKARTRLCMTYPVRGKTRCRLHGAKGGAPRGPGNGKWKHGARATYVEPLNETEAEMLRGYADMARIDTAKDARAKQALLHNRAFLHAIHSGDAAAAARETRALVALLDVEHRIERGFVVNHVIDERTIGALVRLVFAVLEARIIDKELLAAIVEDMGRVDWTQAAEIPALEATVAAAGEHR